MSQIDRIIGQYLIGQRIVTVRNLTPQEHHLLFGDETPPGTTESDAVIVLESGARLVALADQEINGLGVMGILTPHNQIYTID
jgi:hypothetical protein